MKLKLILVLALILFVPFRHAVAGETSTNRPPPALVHRWEYLTFSENVHGGRYSPTFLAGYGEYPEEESQGFKLEIMDITPGFFKTNAITAWLYRANGEIVEPTAMGKKLLNAPSYIGWGPLSGQEPAPQVMTFFPWGTNALAECWIEVSMGPERYWLEIPYGFDQDPALPLSPPIAGGPPRFVPAMKSLTEHDQVIHWENVQYDLGQIQNGWRLSLRQANPFYGESKVELYKEARAPWSLFSPRTTVRLLDADGTVINGRCTDLHLNEDNMRRTDTFQLGGGDDGQRSWDQIEISVDDQAYRVVVPSSLYKYTHGRAYQPDVTAFLANLRTGMSPAVTDMLSRNYNGSRISPALSATNHECRYVFKSDASEVSLQFDASGNLLSWK